MAECRKVFTDIYGDDMEVVRVGDKVFFGPTEDVPEGTPGEFGFELDRAASVAAYLMDLVTKGDC